jgi:Protein of unknown function (DUF3383)
MANIDRIVNVQISLQTAFVQQNAFSDLLLYGPFTKIGTSLVGIITSADQLIDDYGVAPTDPLYKAASVAFSQIPTIPQLYIGWSSGAADPTADLAAIKDENNNWYAWCNVAHDETKVLKGAQWTEANEKLFVTVLHSATNSSPAAGDTTSIGHQLMSGNYFRTAWWYDPDLTEFPDVGITAKSFTKYPGQETWANQRLDAVTYVPLTETLAQNVFDKNGNTFEQFRNIAITQNGKTAGGEWIDVIRFRDWLCDDIKVRIFQQMIDNRIPYTDPGIAIIRTRLAQSLDFGVVRGGIAPPEVSDDNKLIPSYIITVPLAADISPNQKASRVLQDVYFTARLAGAIHAVQIKGALTYETLPVGSVPVIA